MTSIPLSSDLPNIHDRLGTKRDAQFLLTEATKRAIAQTGYELHGGEKGHGGFGVAFGVKHQQSGARAIVKVMLDPADAQHLKAFQRECRVLASEHVPGDLVPRYITDVQQGGVQPFVLMEFIDGIEIHKYVSQPHRLDLDRRIEIVEKLFRAYQRLHDCNIVHGDPSPRNTLVQSGDRIRFIDFGSACRLSQGYGTLGTVSLKGITPGYGDDDILINGKRPDRWTDLYAAAAIAFHVLTDQSPPQDDSAWEQVLTAAQVPRGVCSVILKARRKRDERQNEPDKIDPLVFQTAGDAADAIQAWRTHRDRRQQRLKQSLVTAALLLIVGTIGAVGWWNYNHERQLGDRRALEDLRRQVESLANASHPGVARLIGEATGEGVPVKRALALLSQARAASRDIEWAESMRQSLGDVLNESPWLLSAKAIGRKKDELDRQFFTLKVDLDAGRTDDLQPRLAKLHEDLAKLAHENSLAAPADKARADYARLAGSVAERLKGEEVFKQIHLATQDTFRLLDDGKWHDAVRHFGSATQRLNEWLGKKETPQERGERFKADAEAVERVEREKDQLKGDVSRVYELVQARDTAIAKLNVNLATVGVEGTSARKAKDDAEAELKLVRADNQRLKATNARLAKNSDALPIVQEELTNTKMSLETTQNNLATAQAETKTTQQRAATAEAQALIWKKAAEDKGGASTVSAAEEAAKLQAQIARVDTGNLKQAEEALAAAQQRYVRLTSQRQGLLTTFKPDSPAVNSKDGELDTAGQQLEAALGKLDAAHQSLFKQFESRIESQQKEVQRLTVVEGLLDTAARVVAAKRQLAELKLQQQPFAAGTQRAKGSGKKLTIAEMAGVVGQGQKAGDRRVLKIKGVEFAFRWCPPGSFKMGADNKQQDVTLTQGFWMLETEFTQEMWIAVMGTRPWQGQIYVKEGANYPATYVSWNDAVACCQKLTTEAPHTDVLAVRNSFTLPTEAQWEYACRAGTSTAYSFGDDDQKLGVPPSPSPTNALLAYSFSDEDQKLGEYAWFDKNANNIGEQYAHQAGMKKPNPWGLSDMHGNVWEWCQDWHNEFDKTVKTDPLGPTTGTHRVLRGGSWANTSKSARVPDRGKNPADNRGYSVGFRVVAVGLMTQ